MLEKEGFQVTVAPNGVEALYKIQRTNFDALLTDWMMPQMDGIELIRRVRSVIKPVPLIVMITSISTRDARQFALESGADEFITKPVYPKDIIQLLRQSQERKNQSPAKTEIKFETVSAIPVGYTSVVIGASSGGPIALKKLFQKIECTQSAAFFTVLHGPEWMLQTFAEGLQNETALKVVLGKDNLEALPGHVYIAPGNRHMVLKYDNVIRVRLEDSPPVNYVKPAVDPLFRSAAAIFGSECIAAVLTGMGCDGSLGAAQVARCGGIVLAQDPKTATVGSMPEKTIELGIVKNIAPLDKLGELISFYVRNFSLKKSMKK